MVKLITTISVIATIVAAIAAIMVVPEVRYFLNLEEPPVTTIAPENPRPSSGTEDGEVTFRIRDFLGEGQVSETAYVWIDGRYMDAIQINTNQPSAEIRILALDGPGFYNYTLTLDSVHLVNGQEIRQRMTDSGRIEVEGGEIFEVYSNYDTSSPDTGLTEK